ncbi:MAG: ATP-binding protein [Candidatus Eiseniibacteriota bacterium]|nr:MAG: ATP-binding protein [Candidatus Eisenbacteria bacterium]
MSGESLNENQCVPCIKLILPGNLGFLRVVDRVSDSVAEYMGFDEEERNAIAISVVEAGTNAIQHGCDCDETRCVTISFYMEGERIRITVEDPGSGFDPDAKDCVLEETGVCRGRGLAIMKAMMDEVLFHFQGGTSITLLKRKSVASQNTGT